MKQSTSATPSIANQENITAQYSSSSSEDEAEASVNGGRIRLDEEEEESSEEDEYTIKVSVLLVWCCIHTSPGGKAPMPDIYARAVSCPCLFSIYCNTDYHFSLAH